MKYPNPNNYAIKALKTWDTNDGGGYQCKITRPTTRGPMVVGEMHNDGNGGCYQFQWVHPMYEQQLTDFLKTLPEETYDFGDGKTGSYAVNADCFFDELVSDFENAKRYAALIARHKKTKVVFRLATDDPLEIRFVKSLNVPAVRAMLDKKYGANGYTVL